MKLLFYSCIIFIGSWPFFQVKALDNGLVRTPPMAWNSWNIFHENINENQIREIADAIVSSDMKDAGYIYLNLDDNWMASSRDADGNLRADPTRFPSGMKALGDYIHSKGLKFGIYGDRGMRTCHHYYSEINSGSGSYGNEQRDANTFASWGVDYIKYDNCDPAPGSNMQEDYEKMRDALANCGRDIVFSICAWEFQPWMPNTGNLWRTAMDIGDEWDIPNSWNHGIINCVDLNADLAEYAKPGAWNDPDMLEIGNGGCTTEEYRTQMSMWSIMAAPLIAGNDVRNMSQDTKDILLNKEIIAVDQDSAGIQGTRVKTSNGLEVWCKPLGSSDGPEKAVALLNRNGGPEDITVNFADIGLSDADTVSVRDLWAKEDRGTFSYSYTMTVPSHGTGMLKIRKIPGSISAFSLIEAESYYNQSGIQAESCSEGGEYIGYIENGDYAVYKNVDFESGASEFEVRVASAGSGGNIEIRLDSITGLLVGTCEVTETGDWQNWSTFTCSISNAAGKHDLYLKFTGDDGYLFNINWFQFIKGNVPVEKQVSVSDVSGYRIKISDGNIIIISNNNHQKFSVLAYMTNGRQIIRRLDVMGSVLIPAEKRGVYLVIIRCNEYIERKKFLFF